MRNQAKKKAEQLKLGRELGGDPEGVNGYNAFVNEPAEASARVTLDETANTAEFSRQRTDSKQRWYTEWKTRPLLDNDTQELLARADASTRATSFVRWRSNCWWH